MSMITEAVYVHGERRHRLISHSHRAESDLPNKASICQRLRLNYGLFPRNSFMTLSVDSTTTSRRKLSCYCSYDVPMYELPGDLPIWVCLPMPCGRMLWHTGER